MSGTINSAVAYQLFNSKFNTHYCQIIYFYAKLLTYYKYYKLIYLTSSMEEFMCNINEKIKLVFSGFYPIYL